MRSPAPVLAHDGDAEELLVRSSGHGVVRFMVDAVLARRPLPDLGRALETAWGARRLTLARRLVALGADATRLAAWVRTDLITPPHLEVRYRAAAEPQTVRVVLRTPKPKVEGQGDPAKIAVFAASRLVRLGEAGTLGSDRFAPTASGAELLESSVTDDDTSRTTTLSMRVKGIAPEGIALALRVMIGQRPLAISLTGELPLDASVLSVDTQRALGWIADLSCDPLRAWTDLPFRVSSKPKKGFAVIEHAPGLWQAIQQKAVGPIGEAMLTVMPAVPADADVPQRLVDFDSKKADTKTELVLKRFDGAQVPDTSMLRAMLVNALVRIGGITEVRWNDDAGVPAEEAPKPAPKAKTEKKTRAFDGPVLGPSTIEALLAATSQLPWSDVGAARSALPAAIDGHAVPPTLRAWLASPHAKWPLWPESLLAPRGLSSMLGERAPDLAPIFGALETTLLPGACVPLFAPSTCADGTVLFLYLPLASADGEAPVLGLDPTDEGLVGVFAPRFDRYLERVFGRTSQPWTFASTPETDPYLRELVARLPAKRRKRATIDQGVIALGALLS